MTQEKNGQQPQELIDRINELAKKKKAGTLTEQEAKEQAELRQEYLNNFRKGLKDRIEHTKLYDKEGKEITSDKVHKIQKENGWRED